MLGSSTYNFHHLPGLLAVDNYTQPYCCRSVISVLLFFQIILEIRALFKAMYFTIGLFFCGSWKLDVYVLWIFPSTMVKRENSYNKQNLHSFLYGITSLNKMVKLCSECPLKSTLSELLYANSLFFVFVENTTKTSSYLIFFFEVMYLAIVRNITRCITIWFERSFTNVGSIPAGSAI